MAPPGEGFNRIALFCTAKDCPMDWAKKACEIATKHDDWGENLPGGKLDMVDIVGATKWTIQQMAEWVVTNLVSKEDDRASRSVAIVDDKSEATNSFVIVVIAMSSFGLDPYGEPLVEEERSKGFVGTSMTMINDADDTGSSESNSKEEPKFHVVI